MGPWSCSNDHLREAGRTSATPIATAHRSTIVRTPKLPTFLPYSTVPVAQSAAVSLNLGFNMKEPNLGALAAITDNYSSWVYPPEVIKEHGDVSDWRNLVGTGPMMLTDWTAGSSVTWTKNPDYWGYDDKLPENRLPYVERRQVALGMPPPLQRRQRGRDVLGRRRDEAGGARPSAADPVLRSADLVRQFVTAADPAHQDAMGIAQQADAERQPVRIGELDASVCERIRVVADLLDTFESLGTIGCLKRDDIQERGLRPFDLRRDDRLLADEAVEEPIGAPAPSFRLPQGGRERPQHRRGVPPSVHAWPAADPTGAMGRERTREPALPWCW